MSNHTLLKEVVSFFYDYGLYEDHAHVYRYSPNVFHRLMQAVVELTDPIDMKHEAYHHLEGLYEAVVRDMKYNIDSSNALAAYWPGLIKQIEKCYNRADPEGD